LTIFALFFFFFVVVVTTAFENPRTTPRRCPRFFRSSRRRPAHQSVMSVLSNSNGGDEQSAPHEQRITPKQREPADATAVVEITSTATTRRRDAIAATVAAAALAAAAAVTGGAPLAGAATEEPPFYRPAPRPVAYRVDSTVPPTLLPVGTARARRALLEDLGRGGGTDKEAVVVDTLNLNNMLNRAVFGAAGAVRSLLPSSSSGGGDSSSAAVINRGPGSASFVCLGLPSQPVTADIELAKQLCEPIVSSATKSRKQVALALSFAPYSTQETLLEFTKGAVTVEQLADRLQQAGVDAETVALYVPLIRWAADQKMDLLALSPELSDRQTALDRGLQNVPPEQRAKYVLDPEGFISMVNDPRFKLYTDRSLLKDFTGTGTAAAAGSNFFAERILTHEAAATAMAQYAAGRPESLVVAVAPVNDLRFLSGLNGRIPRIHRHLVSNSKVTDAAVTTVLLNPTAVDTLSKSRYLRLEIGTAPDTLQYQTKVADYLWFSSSPKVNLLPRLMNG
jgi:hypothetical protein